MLEPNDLRDQIGYLLTGPVLEICQLRAALRERDALLAEKDAELAAMRAVLVQRPDGPAPLHVVPNAEETCDADDGAILQGR